MRITLRALTLLAACLVHGAAHGEDWPSRPLKVVVALPAGSGPDVLARIVGQGLAERLGQPLLIENRPGAGETIGTAAVVQAAPDGYTLLFAATSLAANPHLYALPYDAEKALVPIAQVGTSHFLLVGRADLPARTLGELIDYAKARPGKLTCAQSTGALLIACAWLNAAAGIDLTLVPFKGSAQATTEVLSGRLDLTFAVPGNVAAHVQADRLLVFASTAALGSEAARRGPPPLAQTLAGFELVSWFGFAAPAGTPPAIVQRLEREIGAALEQPQTRARMEQAGNEVGYAPAQAFARTIAQTRERYGRIIRQAGIRAE